MFLEKKNPAEQNTDEQYEVRPGWAGMCTASHLGAVDSGWSRDSGGFRARRAFRWDILPMRLRMHCWARRGWRHRDAFSLTRIQDGRARIARSFWHAAALCATRIHDLTWIRRYPGKAELKDYRVTIASRWRGLSRWISIGVSEIQTRSA